MRKFRPLVHQIIRTMASDSGRTGQVGHFNTTRWSVVLQAGSDGVESRQAFEQLAQDYWSPLYAFLCRKGVEPNDAEDCIQSFFIWLLEDRLLSRADRERGRLRSFLIAALLRFRSKDLRTQSARKRRPSGNILSIDRNSDDSQVFADPADGLTPEQIYERQWALTVIQHAMQKLQEESELQGKGDLFNRLQGFLTGQKTHSGRQIAEELGMTEAAVRAASYRLRRRFATLLLEQVADTLDTAEEVEVELQHLLRALNP